MFGDVMREAFGEAKRRLGCEIDSYSGWLARSGIADGPLFRSVSKAGKVLGDPLSAGAVATIVKQRVAQIGLDPARYSGHSLRAGFATSAAAAGLPVWRIKGQTGHVSDAVLGGYIREGDLFSGLAAIWSPKAEEPPALLTAVRQREIWPESLARRTPQDCS